MSVSFWARRPQDMHWSNYVTIDDVPNGAIDQLARAGYVIDIKEREVSEPEFTIKVVNAEINITEKSPRHRQPFAPVYESNPLYDARSTFKLEGRVEGLMSPQVSNVNDYDIEVTVKLKRKFLQGHYRNKRKGARATVLYFSTAPWTRTDHDPNPNHWERVNITRSQDQ